MTFTANCGPGSFCIKWNTHCSTINESLVNFFETQTLTDVTLFCEGKTTKCHKIVLSACSPLFATMYEQLDQDLTMINNIEFSHLMGILCIRYFMYKGSVIIPEDEMESFVSAARILQVKGFDGDEENPKEINSPPLPLNKETDQVKISKYNAEPTAAVAKSSVRKYRNYSTEDLNRALQAVRAGEYVTNAANANRIPRRTLYQHMKSSGVRAPAWRLVLPQEDLSSSSASSLSGNDLTGGSSDTVPLPEIPSKVVEDDAVPDELTVRVG